MTTPNPRIGFTGTQQGMTKAQSVTLHSLLSALQPTEFHHGDCIGADAEAHQISTILKIPKIVIHPPIISTKRANCSSPHILPVKDYLLRNRDIVDATDILIATPKEATNQLRSGTWSTYRYANKLNRPTILVYPDGSILDLNQPSQQDLFLCPSFP